MAGKWKGKVEERAADRWLHIQLDKFNTGARDNTGARANQVFHAHIEARQVFHAHIDPSLLQSKSSGTV